MGKNSERFMEERSESIDDTDKYFRLISEEEYQKDISKYKELLINGEKPTIRDLDNLFLIDEKI